MQLPSGSILLWYGAIVDIPAGFVLCDGNNGTPDLRGKFVPGAGGAYAPDDTGGGATHTHAFTSDGHAHDLQAGAQLNAGVNWADATDTDTDSGTTDAGSSLPPYHALAYIMKT